MMGAQPVPRESVELVRGHFERIWNQRDPVACDDLMAVDFVEHGVAPFAAAPPGAVNGPEAMRGTVRWLVDQFPDLRFEVIAVVAEDDLVAARVRSRGTNLGRLNGFLPASGREFES